MKYKISNEEKVFINEFKNLRMPSIFKTDNTEFILFVEEVNFTICEILLTGKEITEKIYKWILTDSNNGYCPCFNDFVKVTDKFYVDEYSKAYCNKIMKIVEIFEKYYFFSNQCKRARTS